MRTRGASLLPVAVAVALFLLSGCTDRKDVAPVAPSAPADAAARVSAAPRLLGGPPGYQTVAVQVPAALRSPPFDIARPLTIPTSYSIAVIARIPGARFMALTSDNRLLVSVRGSGQIKLVRKGPSGQALVTTFRSGLRSPQDMVFATLGGTTYLYFTESHRVSRAPYVVGDLTMRPSQVVVGNLPDGLTPGLGGYGHPLKNIAIDASGQLYVSIASTCNVCVSDTQSNPVRASIYTYAADGSGGRLYARGIRNGEGLATHPTTQRLWVVVNNRDQIPYPFNDSSGNYGRVFAGFVDDHPPDEFIGVRDGGNYGWPFCNPNPNTVAGYDDMPFDDDYEMNFGGSVTSCASMDRVTRGIQAHSAPLGMSLLQSSAIATYYREGALVALHGSWNRSVPTGAKVLYFTWDPLTQRPELPFDFVSGWNTGAGYWGRPVDAIVDPAGAVLISDDYSGTIYRMRQVGPVP